MVTGSGGLRSHWQPLLASIGTLPGGGLGERAERAAHLLREEGVTYIVHAAERGGGPAVRAWSLDPVPLVLGAEEWAGLAAGLAQRARLLNAVLADLYGPQLLLREGLLPPATVYANPQFLRAMRPADWRDARPWLTVHAADLVRGRDGRWRVAADRTQAPAGLGYALENRRVLARALPEPFQYMAVRQLRPFFEAWQAALRQLAGDTENPRAVLLTPGPYNETYFEQVYLARELGLQLVEGADLTVRDGQVHLKTLGGLQQVDVIYRRLDGIWCDPLELRADSALGVTGLVEAARSGSVAIANQIGSGLAESPGIAVHLPALCRRLLGEELMLPTVEGWWCGTPEGQARARAARGAVTLVPAQGRPPARGGSDALWRWLDHEPHRLVAFPDPAPSLMPRWDGERLVPAPITLRAFTVWRDGTYDSLPGGLARVLEDTSPFQATMQRGGTSKDVWVLATEGEDMVVPLPGARIPLAIRRTSGELPSRVADNLYWLGRYIERLDAGARLFRAAFQRLVAGGMAAREAVELASIAGILARNGLHDPAAVVDPAAVRLQAEGLVQAVAGDRPFRQLFGAVERLADASRDRFSVDMWQTMKAMSAGFPARITRAGLDHGRLIELLDELVRAVASVAGMASENMTRGSGWRFLDLGRRVERAIGVARAAAGCLAMRGAALEGQLRLLLELMDSTITYRTRYLSVVQAAPVLDLALADDSNPRSLAAQLNTMTRHLEGLPQAGGGVALAAQRKLAQDLRIAVGVFDPQAVARLAAREDEAADFAALTARLRDIEQTLMALSDDITRAYFSHVPLPLAVGVDQSVARPGVGLSA
ncbi:MAG: circularly permuted type 2 ATP-grasp protein [Thalassobaculales bacterium]